LLAPVAQVYFRSLSIVYSHFTTKTAQSSYELNPLDHHTSMWATLFQAERDRLQYALGVDALDIQHIGSTTKTGLLSEQDLTL
jgi:GrpB-like predicted nucleotidyltransferase (UPF0157 family)